MNSLTSRELTIADEVAFLNGFEVPFIGTAIFFRMDYLGLKYKSER